MRKKKEMRSCSLREVARIIEISCTLHTILSLLRDETERELFVRAIESLAKKKINKVLK